LLIILVFSTDGRTFPKQRSKILSDLTKTGITGSSQTAKSWANNYSSNLGKAYYPLERDL
jgi:hypothetical protein